MLYYILSYEIITLFSNIWLGFYKSVVQMLSNTSITMGSQWCCNSFLRFQKVFINSVKLQTMTRYCKGRWCRGAVISLSHCNHNVQLSGWWGSKSCCIRNYQYLSVFTCQQYLRLFKQAGCCALPWSRETVMSKDGDMCDQHC